MHWIYFILSGVTALLEEDLLEDAALHHLDVFAVTAGPLHIVTLAVTLLMPMGWFSYVECKFCE